MEEAVNLLRARQEKEQASSETVRHRTLSDHHSPASATAVSLIMFV